MNKSKWQAIEAKGKKRWLWYNGFVCWGLITATIWSVVMYFADPAEPIWLRPLIAYAAFPFGGLFWAQMVWASSAARYKKGNDA